VSLANPVRHPDLRSSPLMTRRAWWLVGLGILIPGSPQLLAGSRRLGRFAVSATFVLWGLLVLALLGWFVARGPLLSVFGTAGGLMVVGALLAFYAVLWVMLAIDTFRLLHIPRIDRTARAFVGALSVVSLVIAGGAGYGAYLAISAGGFISDVFITAPAKDPVDGRYNIMLLGGDAGEDREGLRPDSISVVSIDVDSGEATIIGLPRELKYVPFVDGSPKQAEYPDGYGVPYGCNVGVCYLNSVYTEADIYDDDLYPDAAAQGSSAGVEATRDAVEGVTGLEIQYYVLLEMGAFESVIDSLGGVEIDVQSRVPIGGHIDDYGQLVDVGAWIEPGVQRLDGNWALWYARSRYGSNDYDRMQRQKQLQSAVLAQFTPATLLSRFQSIASAGAELVETDVPQSALGYFVNLGSKTRDLPIQTLELIPDTGVNPEDPDYPYIRQMIADRLSPAPAEGQ